MSKIYTNSNGLAAVIVNIPIALYLSQSKAIAGAEI